MLNKLLIGGAVGASIFAIAGASASQLTNTSTNGAIVQQTDALTATCTSGGQMLNVVGSDGHVDAVRMFQQDFQKQCQGDQAQAVLTLNSGAKVYSNVDTFNGDGLDVYLTFPAGTAPLPSQVASTQVTIAGQIQITGEGVSYTNQYGGKPDEQPPA